MSPLPGASGRIDRAVTAPEQQDAQTRAADLLGLAPPSATAASSTSGAPSSQLPLSPKDWPLHFFADENGATAVGAPQPGASGKPSLIASTLALGRGSAAASAASACRAAVSSAVLGGTHLGQAHPVLGERAGLVGAHDVDPGETLDGGQLLDEALALAEADDPDGEGDRRHQHETFGHHRHECGDHPAQRASERLVAGEQLVVDDQQPGGDHQVGDEPEDLVDAGAQLRLAPA